jgi:hypothetical protein
VEKTRNGDFERDEEEKEKPPLCGIASTLLVEDIVEHATFLPYVSS